MHWVVVSLGTHIQVIVVWIILAMMGKCDIPVVSEGWPNRAGHGEKKIYDFAKKVNKIEMNDKVN